MPRQFTSTQLARLKREFVEQPLTAEQIADGAITASKLDTDYAEVTDLDSANMAIQSLDGRVDVLETDLANLASGLAPVAISGAYADLTGAPVSTLHIEELVWAGGEVFPYDHTLAHAPVGAVQVFHDGTLALLAGYTVVGNVLTIAVDPVAATTTFVYIYEA